MLVREHFHSKFTRHNAYQTPRWTGSSTRRPKSCDEVKVKAAYFKSQEIVWEECPSDLLTCSPT